MTLAQANLAMAKNSAVLAYWPSCGGLEFMRIIQINSNPNETTAVCQCKCGNSTTEVRIQNLKLKGARL